MLGAVIAPTHQIFINCLLFAAICVWCEQNYDIFGSYIIPTAGDINCPNNDCGVMDGWTNACTHAPAHAGVNSISGCDVCVWECVSVYVHVCVCVCVCV